MEKAALPPRCPATFGYILPAVVIVMLLAWTYYRYRTLPGIQGVLKGLHPAIAAAMVFASMVKLSANAFWGGIKNFSLPDTNLVAVALTAVMLVLLQKKKIGPVQAILISGALGGICYAIL